MKFLSWGMAAAVAAAIAAGATPASALVFNLTSDHCTGGCGTAGTIFGTVTVDQNGANVDVTVHLNSGFGFADTGAADHQAFKFNATGVILSDITIDPHLPQILLANVGALNGDGTGNFGFGIACSNCGGGLSGTFSTDIVFHVANAVIADITAPNNNANVFVADIGNLTTGNTGPVDAQTFIGQVPGPIAGAGLPGLVMACGGLLGLARRRRRQIA